MIDAQDSQSFLDSRAESPSSPLTPLPHLPCTRLLGSDARREAKSAFRRGFIAPLAPLLQRTALSQPKVKVHYTTFAYLSLQVHVLVCLRVSCILLGTSVYSYVCDPFCMCLCYWLYMYVLAYAYAYMNTCIVYMCLVSTFAL